MINGKFVFFGWNSEVSISNILPAAIISFDTEENCVFAAKLWANVNEGHTRCYCVQAGVAGIRPFKTFWYKPPVYRDYSPENLAAAGI